MIWIANNDMTENFNIEELAGANQISGHSDVRLRRLRLAGLNDAAFAYGMEDTEWIDAPGSYHNGGCGFDFADGHSEIHKWMEKPVAGADANATDWGWMQQRTSTRVGSEH